MLFSVYILYNEVINKYYVGHTSNIEKRLLEHNKKGHKIKFSKKQKGNWNLVHIEKFKSRSEAINREKYIKSMKSRKFIVDLIR